MYAVRQNLRTLEKIRIASVDKASTAEALRFDVAALLETGDRTDEYRTKRRKLDDVCHDLTSRTKDELAAIESAQEKLGILVALRSSADGGNARNSTPRKELGAKGKAPTPAGRRGPPDRPIWAPLARRRIAAGGDAHGTNTRSARGARWQSCRARPKEADWLKASVLSFAKSTNEYTVQDDDEPGPEGTYKVGMENIIPLPISLQTMPASDYPAGSRVLGMYPTRAASTVPPSSRADRA